MTTIIVIYVWGALITLCTLMFCRWAELPENHEEDDVEMFLWASVFWFCVWHVIAGFWVDFFIGLFKLVFAKMKRSLHGS